MTTQLSVQRQPHTPGSSYDVHGLYTGVQDHQSTCGWVSSADQSEHCIRGLLVTEADGTLVGEVRRLEEKPRRNSILMRKTTKRVALLKPRMPVCNKVKGV